MSQSVDIYLADSSLLPEGWEALATQVAGRYGADFEARSPNSTRKEALCAGMLLRLVLGVTSDEDLVLGPYGKPALAKGYPFFNLSDADGWCVLAVASEEVGVDAEPWREHLGTMEGAAARRVFSPALQQEIEQAPVVARARLFTRAWTRLEAALKGDGRGFTVDPDYEEVTQAWKVETADAGKLCISCALTSEEPSLWLRPVSASDLYELMVHEAQAKPGRPAS